MNVRRYALIFSIITAACAAHGTQDGSDSQGTGGPGDPNDPNGGGSTSGNPNGGGNDTTPHALGTILLGETRTSANPSESTPVIAVAFSPTGTTTAACGTALGACQVLSAPDCKTGTMPGCASNEVCTYDDQCAAKCVPTCSASCQEDEECYFPSPGIPACRAKTTFDAGAVAFSGTTTAITLFPPYTVKPTGLLGAPFLAGDDIRVQASGAADIGFDQFDDKFTSTTFLLTSPPLAKLSRTVVFGTGDVPVSWKPGKDTITISAGGPAATATCKADDTSGKFTIPRNVLDAVMSTSGTTGSGVGSLTISVQRQRTEIHKDKKTIGTIGGKAIDPGWLQLTTSSSEAASFQTCSSGYTACDSDNSCANLMSDARHCGSCTNACQSGYYCYQGSCRP
jgi:hypothetical protein